MHGGCEGEGENGRREWKEIKGGGRERMEGEKGEGENGKEIKS